MSFLASMILVYGFAGLLVGGALSLATGLFAWRVTPKLAWGAALLTLASSLVSAFSCWRHEAETKPWMDHALKQ